MATAAEPQVDDAGAELEPRRSIIDTWTEVLADAGGLVRAEAAMARLETTANLKSMAAESAKVAGGGLLLALAATFLTVAAVVALAELIGLLFSLLVIAALCAVCGLVLVQSGRSRLASLQILPEKSLSRMSRDLERLAERGAPVEHSVGPREIADETR